MSIERSGNALPHTGERSETTSGGPVTRVVKVVDVAGERVDHEAAAEPDAEASRETEVVEFVRFCYRRRSVAWPELYDEMCAVAARGEYRGMTYEQLERIGIGFALAALPRLAELVARVIAEERGHPVKIVPAPA